jgi:hypothetical protein
VRVAAAALPTEVVAVLLIGLLVCDAAATGRGDGVVRLLTSPAVGGPAVAARGVVVPALGEGVARPAWAGAEDGGAVPGEGGAVPGDGAVRLGGRGAAGPAGRSVGLGCARPDSAWI